MGQKKISRKVITIVFADLIGSNVPDALRSDRR